MAELFATSPLAARAPVTFGEVSLGEVDPGPITVIAPFRGNQRAVGKALRRAARLDFPAPGQVIAHGAARVIWSGHSEALLVGAAPPVLRKLAAVTDASDGWAVLRLEGAQAAAVLARLVPVDLRAPAFGPGRVVRSALGEIAAVILRAGDGFEVMVMRSFAESAWHELETAMRGVAARG